MTGVLKGNGTVGAIISGGSTSTSNYGFPSGSFTHPKQPIMPSDQKAKLLAMHRDGKANAGIYVAVVLLVYFVLVTLLLCRYGKRRRSTASEPSSTLDSTAEQGRFTRCFRICRTAPGNATGGGGDGCCKCCFSGVFCRKRCSSQADNIMAKAMSPVDCGEKEVRGKVQLNDSKAVLKDEDPAKEARDETEPQGFNCDAGKINEEGMGQLAIVMTRTENMILESDNQPDSDAGESTEED